MENLGKPRIKTKESDTKTTKKRKNSIMMENKITVFLKMTE